MILQEKKVEETAPYSHGAFCLMGWQLSNKPFKYDEQYNRKMYEMNQMPVTGCLDYFLDLVFISIIYFLRFDCYSFSSFLRWRFWLFILYLSHFLIYAFNVINFLLSTAFALSHKFWCAAFSFLFSSTYFKITWDFFDHMLLKVWCLISKYCAVFQLSFCYCLLA